jgi:hypothetical protein
MREVGKTEKKKLHKKPQLSKISSMKKLLYLIVACAFVTSGCSVIRVDSTDVTTNYYPSKSSKNEVVFVKEVNQPHEVIGTVTVNTERNQRLNEVLEKMKYEAAILGGDAITNLKSDATGTWKKLPVQNVVGNGYVRANFTASVVVFD